MVRALAGAGLLVMTSCGAPDAPHQGFAALDGWEAEDHAAALAEFRRICAEARFSGAPLRHWAALCVAAARAEDPKGFFERHFEPARHDSPGGGLVTAYYEPVLDGALRPGGGYEVPLYGLPQDLDGRAPYLTRAEIGAGALAGRGLEIAWLADPAEAFFLQIQGSGRIRLQDGTERRLGYAGKNGHPYVAIGRLLVEDGEMELSAVTADAIKDWLRADPVRGAAMMDRNPSYVFFRELPDLPPGAGPIGTLGMPLTAGRSVAVDPVVHPLGLPVWIAVDTPAGPLRRLWFAADTGGAIKGPGRADLFLGSGAEAGRAAGALRARGQVAGLVPRGPG
ncbi:MAG TPA: murein transglycosylase A [Thermohalobaculum sp.]|nr:murein transglycosylase A [Thermohalobaculum sp.]